MKLADQVAILVPTRNRAHILARTLDELQAGGFAELPLIVYDDASMDPRATADLLDRWPSSLLIRGGIRSGQAKGRNILLQACPRAYALMLDDDSWPEDILALEGALQTMRRRQLAVATFQYRSLADGALSFPLNRKTGPSSTFLGGASMFHVPSILEVGGYRELLVYGYEEPELAFRLWIAGKRIAYDPKVVVAHNHFESPSENRNAEEYDFLYARNAILMSSLNMPLLIGLPHGLLRSFRRSLFMKRNAWAKIRGTFAGVQLSLCAQSERAPCSVLRALQWARWSRCLSR